MSGIYMISALCHRISTEKTYTSLELIRDSYGRKPKDSSSSSNSGSNESPQIRGVNQEDIDKAVADENALMADQEKAAAQTPYNEVNYDEEGYNKDLTNGDILTEDEVRAQFNR